MALACVPRVTILNVAVATDFGSCSEHAVEHGMAVARHFGATLHFLHLLRPSQYAFSPEMIPALADVAVRDCDQLMDRLLRTHRLEGIDCRRWIEQGEIPAIAGEFVARHQIDLLIVGTHGRTGLPRLLLGSAAQQIFQNVSCPVLCVGPRAPGAGAHLQLRRVLFSTDLSPESLAAVPSLLTAVDEWHADLDVVHVCRSDNPQHRAAVDALVARLASEGAASVQGHTLTGKAASCVLDFAASHHADLIVLGLKPHRALFSGPLWPHAYEIVRQAPCPVLSILARPA
ncbi:MAG TPA: universal stress protein [Acidobacteriaceae bacterium]|jgi:nucleotide-binding universal stress UspA family protein